ncbi:MAG: bifunctional phosphopantothenoylcysteine decarboxylase/phosphopantothenate--cysteine ligase CoaBC, partial [Betaproteobacteria bacterium]|nr:bifunctional phosphopantothenoylcysteine decarboxylase/phosphopantothenate--cysteine ligase CoaBC [Betaproteobacteria bacterium]
MQTLADSPTRHLVLGITGGIAAYKCAELVRLWVRAGHTVDVVMTEAALAFVGAATFQALSGRPVRSSLWNSAERNGMDHIALSRNVDALIVAPASADFIGKLTYGLADDLLSTLCLARDCPLLVAPAMNRQMWQNPATQRNVAQLRADGVTILGPDSGEQACGETGEGRMLEPHEIAERVAAYLQPKPLAGLRVLLTAGPTLEPIDPVRAITNRSSGQMGYAVAAAARDAGAEVTLISGPTALDAPWDVERVNVETAAQMQAAVDTRVTDSDIFIGVAAVADYRVVAPSGSKIKKSEASMSLELAANPDILASVAARPNPPFCVGFAAESEHLLEHAKLK